MRRIWIALLIMLLAFGLSNPISQVTQAQGVDEISPTPVVIRSDETGLSLSWSLPMYQLSTVDVDGVRYSQAEIPGLSLSDKPGYPQVPIYGGLIGLPPTGEAYLQVVDVIWETAPLPHPLLPAPVPQPVHLSLADPTTVSIGGSTRRIPDQASYTLDTFQPDKVARLEAAEYVRDHRLARLTIHPVQVNLVRRQIKVVRSIRLEITFTQPASLSRTSGSQQQGDNLIRQTLSATLLNPTAANWGTIPAAGGKSGSRSDQSAGVLINDKTIKAIVTTAGLYVLTYNDLQGVGVPVDTLDPRTLQMSYGYPRQEIAILVEGETDGIFQPGDRILFYAAPNFSRFVDYDAYFLSYGGEAGLRMSSRNGNPAGLPLGAIWRTASAEENRFYGSLYAGRDSDRWYWDDLRQPDLPAGSYPIWLDDPLTSGPEATLTLWLQGYTNDRTVTPDHKVAVSFNGVYLGDIIWDGNQAIVHTFNIPAAGLRAGSNQIDLSLPGVGTILEGVWVDAFELTYPTNRTQSDQLHFQGDADQKAYMLAGVPEEALSVYDISLPTHPQQVVGYTVGDTVLTLGDINTSVATYLIVPDAQLKSPAALQIANTFAEPAGGADYIVITHADFMDAITPLITHRLKQGLRVIGVDVNAIYDAFGSGRLDPEAIRTFIQYAYENWTPPAPLYVLLVGDGHYDFKNYYKWGRSIFIPPYLAEVDPWLGETASDNAFVTVAGNDPLPDLMLGRLSVNTVTETVSIVNKIIDYETKPVSGNWKTRHLFVADNPDYAGDFHANADVAYKRLSPPFTGHRFYYSNNIVTHSYVYTKAETLRTSFLDNFNLGAGLVTFHGHSSWHQWATEALFRWSRQEAFNDVTALRNGRRLPFVLEMTCFTGYFHHPEYPTLDESLLRHAAGGAIAVWGSTGLGVATGHDILQARFYDEIIAQGQTNVGALLLASKLSLRSTGLYQDLLDTYLLFGDPALHLDLTVVPFTKHTYLPIVAR